ncbi:MULTISPECIES: hypothetical protein [Streptomyces]|uniref:Secreted protein n=1 Tax=Streptomyces thermoviolaceus subsp. thermoviolaceus TaxID=66860 RepID=A0ABX0YQ33_STRTL|nr:MULTISPECIES: hypothetical protein [Streptomyces]MCM3263410.1 hypothetical protein [Streptomyces thermoviolaceus]NJP13276.1 hypothetical protein [Streptomyces thermoviolaceus subsp. thermoviolaceus]RSS09050.1 hypothetical protein EF917_00275 [Streptomyces sp. WAC00469]WTD46893.1 hypothetical protein OG899_04830 [Streptomyces thermoviolaceus]GGV71874.1 hypothetical protein GCM10010499_23200 [Streptomyces thermoviolaceus subsp. apingens]
MQHRGRHRRRRRGRALRAVLAGAGLALTAAATLISTSQAEVADDPGALQPLTSRADLDRLGLREEPVPASTLDRLASHMGRPVGVEAVLERADRTLRPADDCPAEETEALPVKPAATRAYCWAPVDADDSAWQPESVATSGDGGTDGRGGSRRVLLSGWTHHGGGPYRDLARVAFVDADDPERPSYSWALLAVPVDGGRDFRGLTAHVTGMVWYRDKLLVTTSGGEPEALYVYDLDRIQRATVDSDAIGRVPGGWSAHGYHWVLPAVAAYRPTTGSCARADRGPSGGDPSGPACPTGLSLDSGSASASLVLSESAPRGSGRHTLLWRYAFSADPARSGLLAADATGTVTATEAYKTKTDGVRGVLAHRTGPAGPTDWYLGRPAGPHGEHGTLWRQNTHGSRTTECGTSDDTRHCWGDGRGSLAYWRQTGEVWSLSGRMLFAVPLPEVERELG